MFNKSQRAKFDYWFAHWCSFQMTALNLGVWKFKYLFHDIEKPWLMLLWKDYSRVQKWHRNNNAHHMEYEDLWDAEAMVIDWECSRFTKIDSPMTARETYESFMKSEYKNDYYKKRLQIEVLPVLEKFGL